MKPSDISFAVNEIHNKAQVLLYSLEGVIVVAERRRLTEDDLFGLRDFAESIERELRALLERASSLGGRR